MNETLRVLYGGSDLTVTTCVPADVLTSLGDGEHRGLHLEPGCARVGTCGYSHDAQKCYVCSLCVLPCASAHALPIDALLSSLLQMCEMMSLDLT